MRLRGPLLIGLILYGLIGAVGLIWIWLRGDDLPGALLASKMSWLLAAGWGCTAAIAVVLLSDLVLDRFDWTDLLRREVLALVGPMTFWKAAAIALASGIAEEMLFRGALLPAVGLVLSSVIFGVLHTGFDRRLLGWSLFAIAAGFLMGWLFLLSGGLLAPIVAHVMINGIQLYRLVGDDGRSSYDAIDGFPGV